MGAALQGLGVDLEEELLKRPQLRVGELLPHAPGQLRDRDLGVAHELGDGVALALLEFLDDRPQQAVLGAEVVDQHAVAGAQRRSKRAEAHVADPVLADILDRPREQAVS